MSEILLVEDSPEYQAVVKRILAPHQVHCAADVSQAKAMLGERDFDLILLDINLPGKDGYSLLQEQQSHPSRRSIPVICVTGNGAVTDKITAFSLGADDYVVKPFDPLELRARVEGKIAKRERLRGQGDLLHAGDLEINQSTHRVSVRGEERKEVDVTQTEFKLLCTLAKNPGRIFSRAELLSAAWGGDSKVQERAVDVHLCALRKKLGASGAAIKAVAGAGYKFVAASRGN